MDEKIPIKVKSDTQLPPHDIKKALNLSQLIDKARQAARPSKKGRVWMMLAIVFMAACALLVANFYYFQSPAPFSLYQNLVPGETNALIILKVSDLNNLSPSFLPVFEQTPAYYYWLKDRINDFLNQANVSATNDLAPILEEEIAFLIMPPQNAKSSWLIIAKQKVQTTGLSQPVFDRIESQLRHEFDADETFYRQIKLVSVHPVNDLQNLYYYAQIKNYILISNDLAGIQKTIDKLIGN